SESLTRLALLQLCNGGVHNASRLTLNGKCERVGLERDCRERCCGVEDHGFRAERGRVLIHDLPRPLALAVTPNLVSAGRRGSIHRLPHGLNLTALVPVHRVVIGVREQAKILLVGRHSITCLSASAVEMVSHSRDGPCLSCILYKREENHGRRW